MAVQCPRCGSPIAPGDAFCPQCGADVRAVSHASPPPPPPGLFAQEPPQPTAPLPAPTLPPTSPEPPPFPAGHQPTQPYPVANGVQTPPLPGQRKSGMSSGAIVGIIAAVVVVVLLLGVGGFFALKGFLGYQGGAGTVMTEPKVAATPTRPAPATETSESATGSSTASDAGAADAGASTSSSAEDGVVTDAEARAVVKKFLDYRVAHNIAASKTLCTKNMLTGENGSFVNDKYWRPDSYKITKTTPDQMYIHVTTMGMWPSGEEPTIYSVWRDPASGKVLIDGMLDPDSNPDLVK
jgi:hypothetical protein